MGPSGQSNRFQDGLSGAVEVPGLALHLGRLFIAEPHKRSSATRLHSIRYQLILKSQASFFHQQSSYCWSSVVVPPPGKAAAQVPGAEHTQSSPGRKSRSSRWPLVGRPKSRSSHPSGQPIKKTRLTWRCISHRPTGLIPNDAADPSSLERCHFQAKKRGA